MISYWNDHEAPAVGNLLDLRVYTSRLLGKEEDLVLHGGGNTSVKITETNIFGEEEEILYVKGSGWDLATIETPGFAPVKMTALKQLADLPELTDAEMVKYQRMAMTDPAAPNPSVEAILHAIIPFTFVDHTHADAVVTITNTPGGEEKIREIYGDRMLIVPYVMPGFILARTIYEMTRDIDWSALDGMVLMNHGVFTFDADARKSYERMIDIVDKAEQYIIDGGVDQLPRSDAEEYSPINIAAIRKYVSDLTGRPMLAQLNNSALASGFANLDDLDEIVNRGPLTPDHIIRTKRVPWVVGDDIPGSLAAYSAAYESYFKAHTSGETMLDAAPRWAVIPGVGALSFGPSSKHLKIIDDITTHTRKAIFQAEQLGGWRALPQDDLFEVEYWELEQAKLKKAGKPAALQGKVALVTGGASGIGKACVEELHRLGASVITVDISDYVEDLYRDSSILGMSCDVTDRKAMQEVLAQGVKTFGGLDIVVSNVGIFPPSTQLSEMTEETWRASMEINLTSHQQLLTDVIPYLELGMEPTFLFIGSKNVPAPGPGASAYSVAKAGLTQLGRVAALELGSKGIRVNVIHPNAVYDTGIWTDEVLQQRASHYGLTVEQYKTNNVLHVEVTSQDVAVLAAQMASGPFLKVTGAQVPIDGGNDRII